MRISDWSSDVCSSDLAADTPRWVSGDAVRLRQILLNLLGNAIKFTDQGEVSLRVEPHGDDVRAVVGDTGPGLNDEQKQRLFRRFEQAEGARTAARYGGSGLGLAICQELRSEEHTSELQSLMRISYAVFCLKKKNNLDTDDEHEK